MPCTGPPAVMTSAGAGGPPPVPAPLLPLELLAVELAVLFAPPLPVAAFDPPQAATTSPPAAPSADSARRSRTAGAHDDGELGGVAAAEAVRSMAARDGTRE